MSRGQKGDMKQVPHKHTHKTQIIAATEQNSVAQCILRQELVHSWLK